MNDSEEKRLENLLAEFRQYWSGQMQIDGVTPFDRFEEIAIRIFARWVIRNFQLEEQYGNP